MDSRVLVHGVLRLIRRSTLRRVLLSLPMMTLVLSVEGYGAGFKPPQNLDAGQSSTPTLDSSYRQEAWLVYSYTINTEGLVTNAKIHVSNGVTDVEDKFLSHVNAMRFRPGTRDDRPVNVWSGAIIYTWILDIPREMSPEFDEVYQQAWALFKQEDYDQAYEFAARLKTLPGRNAFEEIKFQILAASLSSRWEDDTAELSHLTRIVEFQNLADKNRFSNPYVEDSQYLLILERIQTLQLEMMTLADAEITLNKMLIRASDSEVTLRAKSAQREAQARFEAIADVEIAGELTAIYPEGQGNWETRLSRNKFSVSDVRGSIESLYLACEAGGDMRLRYPSREPWTTPPGWNNCTLEAAGRSGTRFTVHELAP